jgi:hypothetical protein
MPQRVEITVTAGQTASLVQHISAIPGVMGIRVQHGGSIRPAGDIISLDVTNRSLPAVARLLVESGIGRSPDTSFSTSEPTTLVSSSSASAIANDSSEAIWEEMEVVIGKNSNMTLNGLIVMAIAGVLATIGIATNALHIVIGAMLIAPGFQPLVRIALGVIGEGAAWRRGALHTLQGYAALVAGAAVTAWLLQAFGKSPLGGESSYLPAGVLISYWTTITVPSVVVTIVSGAAGAILVATNRAVLTAGVMVGLALVPGAAIAGLAAASGEFDLALQGVVRWLMEAGLVLLMSLLVFAWKRTFVHNRAMVL